MNQIEEKIEIVHKDIIMIKKELSKKIIGQTDVIEKLLISLISKGHVLLEGYPGLAKTMMIETLAKIMDIGFKRIQFTPDLLPSDLIGSLIFNQRTNEFIPDKGPIFTNFLMADEINRAPAKVQSALLECMQERKVTIGNHTYTLDSPFFVMATQNPIEQEGTFELPEAQKDRFMFKVNLDYPSREEELDIINKIALTPVLEPRTLINKDHIFEWQNIKNEIFVDEKIKKYVVDIVFATRFPHKSNLNELQALIKLGASPRATLYLIEAGRSKALLEKRTFVIPEDIRDVCNEILQHRIILTYEAMAEAITTKEIVSSILKKIKVP